MSVFKRVILFLKPYKFAMLFVVLSTIAVTGMNLVGPWLVRRLIGLIETGVALTADTKQAVLGLAFLLMGSYVLRGLAQFVTSYGSHSVAWKLVSDMRALLYEHLQKLSLRYYSDKQTGQLMSRVVNDTANLEPLLAHAIPDLLVNAAMLVGITVILFRLNPELAFLTLIPMPILAYVVISFSKKIRPAFRDAQQSLADLNALLQDNLSGIKEIQIFTREHAERGRVFDQAYTYAKDLLLALKLNAIYHPLVEGLGAVGTVIVVLWGGWKALGQELSVQDLVAFVLYLNMFYQPIMILARLNEGLQQAAASAERYFEILDTEPDVKEAPRAIKLDRIQGRIQFDSVSFAYDEDNQVLEDINVEIEPGHTIALVGPTGVGKTTFVSLIPRFYDPQQGEIRVDGHNLKDVSLQSLRKNISIVLQDVFLFNGTIKDNILYGRMGASDEEVVEAAKLANAHKFISSLPNGYDTHIGERGVKLSGGQKQRLSIARAILKNAPILILDEATSSVDTQTEVEIQQALEKLMVDRTTIVIAHRLSTVRNADEILVLRDKGIAERGTHNELMTAQGLYYRLCQTQLTQDDESRLAG